MTRTTLALLLALAIPAGASASLGGTVASVETDRVRTQSALVRITRTNAYSVHEILSPTGTTIREYYGANDVVFGVAWDGEWPPDLRQILGTYFDQYQRAAQSALRGGRSRGRLAIDDNGLIVHAGGHARSFSGIAYAPALLPAGVRADVVR
jgi:hypothetical protein